MAFGCSLTFGQCLPDNTANEKPSDYSYPALIAKKLNRSIVNKAIPGSSNLEILLEILKFDFFPDDLVIIGWTYFERFNNVKFINYEGDFKIYTIKSSEHKRMILDEIFGKDDYIDVNICYKNWFAIHHAHMYLKQKLVTVYGVNIGHGLGYGNDYHKSPQFIKDLNLIIINLKILDFASDQDHPGTKTHEKYAEQIYNKLTHVH